MRYREDQDREEAGALRRSVGATTTIPLQWLGKRARLDPLFSMVADLEESQNFPLVFVQGRLSSPDPAKARGQDSETVLDAWRSLNEQLRSLALGPKDIDVRDVEPEPELVRQF